MTQLMRLAVIGTVIAAFLGTNSKGQRKQEPASITFGTVKVSLGMTVEEVEKALAEGARHIELMSDKHTGVVRINNLSGPDSHEGQVTFLTGRVVYAAFHFPDARAADQLAQEIAGAVENMDTKACEASNWSSHGTGGSLSETAFDCGSKSFEVVTTEVLGRNERYTHVEIRIGSIPSSK